MVNQLCQTLNQHYFICFQCEANTTDEFTCSTICVNLCQTLKQTVQSSWTTSTWVLFRSKSAELPSSAMIWLMVFYMWHRKLRLLWPKRFQLRHLPQGYSWHKTNKSSNTFNHSLINHSHLINMLDVGTVPPPKPGSMKKELRCVWVEGEACNLCYTHELLLLRIDFPLQTQLAEEDRMFPLNF